jgi:NTP pyrophosphatase (non-canonical NTP hydrolase)
LAEECGETIQAIGKILRHGYQSYDPARPGITNNAFDLEKELGDIVCSMRMLTDAGDIVMTYIEVRATEKAEKIKPYLHHQS